MFNLIIVDDKKSIREGLKKFIDWKELGFTVVGDFASAMEAIRFIESESVDVMLTDIVMPDVSGLDLMREAKLINPEIKAIILSAYEKFEYAQEAVRLGAVHYLTKPVNLERLKNEFINLRKTLEAERQLRQQKKEYITYSAERFFNNLVNGSYNNTKEIFKKAKEIEIPLMEGSFCILRIVSEYTPYSENKLDTSSFQLLKSMIADYVSEFLSNIGRVYLFNTSLTELCALYYPERNMAIKDSLIQLHEDIKSSLNCDILIGVGKIYDSLQHANDSFAEAGKALEYRIIKKTMNVLLYQEISDFFKGRSLITPIAEKTILTHLSMQEEDELTEYILDIMINAYKVGQNNLNILYDVCIELLLIINKFLTTNLDKKKSIEGNDYFSIKSLLMKQGFDEIKSFMLGYLKDCFIMIRENENYAGLIIESAKKYINEHYNEEITLSKLSEIVYVNPNYLSRLFKEKCGVNFVDYLTRVRIEHAKRLLEDLSLKVYDIAEMVGYESRKHFGKIFKDITGMSPREYRNKL